MRWVSVDERLPEVGYDVPIVTSDGPDGMPYITYAYITHSSYEEGGEWISDSGAGYAHRELWVTHWAELTLPDEVKAKL